MDDYNFKISVVLACYNGENFIRDQINSILFQSIPPDEIIISDNNSIDDTLGILIPFLDNNSIKLIVNEKNMGYKKNFENALKSATGDLIFISDQDDFWLPNKIELILNEYKKKNFYLLLHDCYIVNSDLTEIGCGKIDNHLFLYNSLDNYVMGACMCISSNFLNIILPFGQYYSSHDNWISDVARYLDKRVIFKKKLLLYRRHLNNTSVGSVNKSNSLVDKLFNKIIINLIPRSLKNDEQRLLQLLEIGKALKISNLSSCKLENDISLYSERIDFLKNKSNFGLKTIKLFFKSKNYPFKMFLSDFFRVLIKKRN